MLLKAKILYNNNNKLNSLYVLDHSAKTKRGKPFKRPPYKESRSGNKLTIDIKNAIKTTELPQRLKDSLELLVEIRDNAIHFINESKLFEKKVLEIGTATLKNYVKLVNEWFKYDLSQYNFYLMPISFYHTYEIESYSINDEDKQHKNLLEYINKVETTNPSDIAEDYNIALRLETKFEKANKAGDYFSVKNDPNDPNAITVKQELEDSFHKKYPWNHKEHLVPKLFERYCDFNTNKKFNDIKKKIHGDINLCDYKYLDMKNKQGAKRRYYSTNVLKEFDKHYTKQNKANN